MISVVVPNNVRSRRSRSRLSLSATTTTTTTTVVFAAAAVVAVVVVVVQGFIVVNYVFLLPSSSSTTTTNSLISIEPQHRQHLQHLQSKKLPTTTSTSTSTSTKKDEETTTHYNYNYNHYKLGPIFYNVYIPTTKDEENNNTNSNNSTTTASRKRSSTSEQQQQQEQQRNAVRIILEQMKQRNMSIEASTSPLWYVQIGGADAGANNPSSSSSSSSSTTTTTTEDGGGVDIILRDDQWCQPNCSLLEHLDAGGEVDTLQHLWEYCQIRQHRHDVVTYIHNKGAYHPTVFNEKIRRRSTKAAFDCRSVLAPSSYSSSSVAGSPLPPPSPFKLSTNVCAGRVSVLPQYLANGNMWSAKCDYISRLIPPNQYESSLRRMYEGKDGLNIQLPVDNTLSKQQPPPPPSSSSQQKRGFDNVNDSNDSNKNNKIIGDVSCLQPTNVKPNHLGIGRFAFERWVWSHPDVIPADVFPSDKVMDKYDRLQKLPDWKPSFRRSFGRDPKIMGLSTTSTNGRSLSTSSFSKLEGRLFEWDFLYQKRPPEDSWIWKFYSGYDSKKEQSMKESFSRPGSYCGILY